MKIVSQNAIKHSFFARKDEISGESRRAGRLFFKKQSQFALEQNYAKSLMARTYGDFNGRRLQKNKANSKPNAGLQPEIRSIKPVILNKTNVWQMIEYDFKKQSQF